MTEKELRDKLVYLINKYVPEGEREPFYELISREDVPVKGILADFNRVKILTVEDNDGELIRDIYFHFC
ncbi:MAG: hypothetical protein KIB40_19720 [Pantoea sp.]|uniref:Uncharacterized protein n=1 Tax=Pantoea brenneri TaxID=472694 RepID=A0AAX3J4M4_9GAMM|nr:MULTISPECIES: hypothetical protein [Pantoea]MBS6035344.1 hypothetical protein [Pantoea sp.]MDH2125510.1 hypothetical protein [Pantoea brenneri]VXB63424.1 conserved hypothetical protein [Pantoea brenneri]